jgi:PAS domain S-box-containing protein
MATQGLKILLVHDNSDSRRQIQQVLCATDIDHFDLECIDTQLIIQNGPGQKHYDLCLIDSINEKVTLLLRSLRVGFNCSIIMLTSDSGSEVLNALHNGASDCLIREQLTPASLEESICAVVQRARASDVSDEYERWYLGLVENSLDLIYTQDLEGNYCSINKVGERLTGYTREEILRMNFRQLIAPEYLDLVWRGFIRMLEDRKTKCHEVAIVTKKGDRVSLRMANHLIYRDGTPIGVQGVASVQDLSISFRAVV